MLCRGSQKLPDICQEHMGSKRLEQFRLDRNQHHTFRTWRHLDSDLGSPQDSHGTMSSRSSLHTCLEYTQDIQKPPCGSSRSPDCTDAVVPHHQHRTNLQNTSLPLLLLEADRNKLWKQLQMLYDRLGMTCMMLMPWHSKNSLADTCHRSSHDLASC